MWGNRLLDSGQYAAAGTEYQESVRLEPGDVAVWILLGDCQYLRLRQTTERNAVFKADHADPPS